MKIVDIATALIGLALCAYVWVSSGDFPQDVVMKIGPDFFPRAVSVCMALACCVLLTQALTRKVHEKAETLNPADPGVCRSLIVLAATLVYVVAMEFLGFLLSTVIFMLFMMYVLRLRNIVKMAAVSAATAVAVNFAFGHLLDIQLPLGVLENLL